MCVWNLIKYLFGFNMLMIVALSRVITMNQMSEN